jgi:hypothetical protein
MDVNITGKQASLIIGWNTGTGPEERCFSLQVNFELLK